MNELIDKLLIKNEEIKKVELKLDAIEGGKQVSNGLSMKICAKGNIEIKGKIPGKIKITLSENLRSFIDDILWILEIKWGNFLLIEKERAEVRIHKGDEENKILLKTDPDYLKRLDVIGTEG